MMSIILTTYLFIKSNIFLLSFLLGMVGEEFVLFLAILAGNGEMPLISVIIGGVLGMLFIGQIYFFIGRSKLISQLDKNGCIYKKTRRKKYNIRDIHYKIYIRNKSSINNTIRHKNPIQEVSNF